MSRTLPALLVLLLCTSSVHALDARQGAASSADATAITDEMARKQKRRDVLREALKVPVEDTPATARQMSAQEKAALRQQLRQSTQVTNPYQQALASCTKT